MENTRFRQWAFLLMKSITNFLFILAGDIRGVRAADILLQITRDQHKREDMEFSDEDKRILRDPIMARFEHERSPYFSNARLWDDGVIDPMDTRRVIGRILTAALDAPVVEMQYGPFRLNRAPFILDRVTFCLRCYFGDS